MPFRHTADVGPNHLGSTTVVRFVEKKIGEIRTIHKQGREGLKVE
jgi:hypothetical protein